MESYLVTPWINFATATATTHGKLTGKMCLQCGFDQMGQHLNDVKKLVIKVVKLDSFVSHFAYHCKKGS
jgi:hypothetical protein